MYHKHTKKEIADFQKSESRKIIDAVNALVKSEDTAEMRVHTQAIQASAIKIEVSLQGLLHEDWKV